MLDSLLPWTQARTSFPEVPVEWSGLLSTTIFLDLCSEEGPALEVKEASFAAMYSAVQAYTKYEEDWSAAELYLACRGLALSNCLIDIYIPLYGLPVVEEILGRFYSAISNPVRLRIVLQLRSAEGLLSVAEVAEYLNYSDRLQSVRRHLRILHEARIIERHWEEGVGSYQYDRRAILAYLELTQEALL